jgi:protein-disulfide isomerase
MRAKYLYIFYILITFLSLWVGWRHLNSLGALHFMRKAEIGQFLGPANSKKILVEVVDYRCPPCRALYPVIKEYQERHPDVKVVVKYIPIYLKPSVNEAKFALAAAMQGRFADVHERLMSRGEEPMTEEEEVKITAELGLDAQRIAIDGENKLVKHEMVTTYSARRVLNIMAVPLFIIGNKMYSMDKGMPGVEDIEKMMDAHYGTNQK